MASERENPPSINHCIERAGRCFAGKVAGTSIAEGPASGVALDMAHMGSLLKTSVVQRSDEGLGLRFGVRTSS